MLHSHSHVQDQAHDDGHSHGHTHTLSSPHPAQAVPWSILRMALAARAGTALAVCVVLWAAVLLTIAGW
ncbi:hypothetical protein [Nitrobacter sp.]|uniref:hypothetical protein n=1 Tax=unclassified Nitrobacter TaxID=2620411 RepID=UPI002B57FE1B|nr:hypothetical protein [Nitrobacter sp.]